MRMIFLNLPVRDLARSTAFFTRLGFEVNPRFSDRSATCLVVDRNIVVMLLAEERFRDFLTGEVADARAATEVVTGLSADSREQVDETIACALAEGGKPWKPVVERGPVYGGSFQDLDGHVWELLHTSPSGGAH